MLKCSSLADTGSHARQHSAFPSRKDGSPSQEVSRHQEEPYQLPLSDLRHICVSIFDQSVRFEGRLGACQTFVCNLSDSERTNQLLNNLLTVLRSAELTASTRVVPTPSVSAADEGDETRTSHLPTPRSLYDGVRDHLPSANQEMRVNGVHWQWPHTTHIKELYLTLAKATGTRFPAQAVNTASTNQQPGEEYPPAQHASAEVDPPAKSMGNHGGSAQPTGLDENLDLLYYQQVMFRKSCGDGDVKSVSCSVAVTNSSLYLILEDTQHWPIPMFLQDVPSGVQYEILGSKSLQELQSVSVVAYGGNEVILAFSLPGGKLGVQNTSKEVVAEVSTPTTEAMAGPRPEVQGDLAKSDGVTSTVLDIQQASSWRLCLFSYGQAEKLVRILQMALAMNCNIELPVHKLLPF